MNPIWFLIIIVSLYLVIRVLNSVFNAGGLPRHFNDLIKKIQTDENKVQIEGAIEFHNNRVAAGADNGISFDRLICDIKRIGDIDENEPKAVVVSKNEVPATEATTEKELKEIEKLCYNILMVWPLNDLDTEHYLCTRRLTELTAKLIKEIRQNKGA